MKWHYFAIIFVIALMTGSLAWVRLEIVRISYDIHELEQRERSLKEECNALTLHIDEAKSPQKLEALAVRKFGMHAPMASQVVVFKNPQIN